MKFLDTLATMFVGALCALCALCAIGYQDPLYGPTACEWAVRAAKAVRSPAYPGEIGFWVRSSLKHAAKGAAHSIGEL